MNIYDTLHEENQRFWDSLGLNQTKGLDQASRNAQSTDILDAEESYTLEELELA